jgi:hypothetical protein
VDFVPKSNLDLAEGEVGLADQRYLFMELQICCDFRGIGGLQPPEIA